MKVDSLNNTDSFRKEDSSVEDYISLLKPRVMILAIFSSICGLILAPGNIHPFLSFVAIICISMGAGASGAINMWYDKDIDSLMNRTKNRPVPRGAIFSSNALGFGVVLGLLSVLLLGLATNYFAAFLLASSIIFYILIYTMWLKRRTHHNIVIGGAAGAFPPVIGWVCVTGELSLYPMLLFLTIFFWTPPHFWALSLYKDVEYSKANIPMLPVVKGQKETKQQILFYSLILFFVSLLPYYYGFAEEQFLVFGTIINLILLLFSYRILVCDDNNTEKKASELFKFSILYLYFYFIILVVEKLTKG
ncbi:heme o synthase [Alphaproteobacteria bacterium]|nr:heme o synthase [Alphaproteobacteria bacterium]